MIIRPHRLFINDDGGVDINGHPYTHEGRILGVIACLVQSFMLSVSMFMKSISGRNVHPITLIVFILVASLVLSPFFAFFNGISSLNWSDITYIVLMGIAYFCQQYFMLKSLQFKEKTGTLKMMIYLQVVFGYLIDVFVIQDSPEGWSVVGTVLIVVSNIFILYK